MSIMNRFGHSSLIPLLAVTLVGSASATMHEFSFTGTFAADDDVQLFSFTTDGGAPVTLRTYSYGGGVQADGNVVMAGGFDTILAVFDAAGNLVTQNDDGGSNVTADPNTGSRWDAYLSVMLAAGNYTVSLTQYNNFANGPTLADGFTQTGDAFFTGALGGCTNGQFCDVSAVDPYNNRSNQWAFDALYVQTASPVPLPAALWLLTSGLLGVVGLHRKLFRS